MYPAPAGPSPAGSSLVSACGTLVVGNLVGSPVIYLVSPLLVYSFGRDLHLPLTDLLIHPHNIPGTTADASKCPIGKSPSLSRAPVLQAPWMASLSPQGYPIAKAN